MTAKVLILRHGGVRAGETVSGASGRGAEPQLAASQSRRFLATSGARAPLPSHGQLEPESELPRGRQRQPWALPPDPLLVPAFAPAGSPESPKNLCFLGNCIIEEMEVKLA